ncbi:hypothetical protein BP5796_11714 [Coleophoma crateriformis]|uniref:Acyl-coenzyme A:6-aminopenicillanic-acid-acyltransferase 40 kDa form n=1 Tax=Coleophoma crateriformis TaxID=565419 RepID=A0A3D8QEN3_9HELO|nr:hypothetical protein BP5796_11714 [Coleophoma crateriformis]
MFSTFVTKLFSDEQPTTTSKSTVHEGYKHILVTGNPYERGYSHGQQAKDKICTNIRQYSTSSSLPSKEICSHYVQKVYLPAIESLFPEGLEEMKGIADGACVMLDDIILLNARYDLSRVKYSPEASQKFVGECTSMAYVQDSEVGKVSDKVYVAQNWDMSPWLHDLDTIIILESHSTDADGTGQPSVIISLTEAGQLARSGLNSCGLGLCANSLWSTEDFSPHTPEYEGKSYLPFTLARRMFLECGNFAAGLKVLSTFPRHVSGNIMVGSHTGLAMDFELSPSAYFALHPTPLSIDSSAVLLTHANHFTGAYGNKDTYPGGSSLFRDVRLFSLLRNVKKHVVKSEPGLKPGLGITDLRMVFGDHAGFPRSLCEHADKGRQKYGAATSNTMTVASVIYDLSKLEIHVCKGNPCCGTWQTYSISR